MKSNAQRYRTPAWPPSIARFRTFTGSRNYATGSLVFKFQPRRADLDLAASRPPRTRACMLALEEVDQLDLLLFEVCSRSPVAFLGGHPDRQKYLTKSNSAWTGDAS